METVERADGTVTARIYQEPAFRKTASGWAPIDARVHAQRDPAAPVVAPDALHPLTFGNSGRRLLDLAVEGGTIGLQWPDGAIGEPSVETEDTVLYRGVAEETDLRFRSLTGGVRTELWLKSAAAPMSFTFHLSDPKGLLGDLRRLDDGSYVSEKRIDDENHLVIERPFAFRPAAAGAAGPTVIEGAGMSVVRAGDGWDVTKWMEPGSLADAEFPVVLDPMLAFYSGPDANSPDRSGTGDCYIASGANASTTYCGYAHLRAGVPNYGTTSAYKARTLLRFEDIGYVPGTAYITSARVGLHQQGAKTAGTTPYDLYEVTEEWKYPDWNQRIAGNSWGTAGGTVAAGIKATASTVTATTTTPSYSGYTWFTGNGLTSLVRRWRTTGQETRYGVLVRSKETNSDNRAFYSSRGVTSGLGSPMLEITYELPARGVHAIAGDGFVKVVWEPQTASVVKHVVNVYREATGLLAAAGEIVCPQRSQGIAVALCRRHAVLDGLTNGETYQATVATHFTDGTVGTTTSNVVVPGPAAGMTGREPWWSYDELEPPDPHSTLEVNMASGNVVLQQLDGTPMQGHGRIGYVLRRTYNSHFANDDTLPGSMGAGWLMNFGEIEGAAADTVAMALDLPVNSPVTSTTAPVYLLDRDGTRHRFTPQTTSHQVLKASLVGQSFDVASPDLGALLPQRLRPGLDELRSQAYTSICIDRTYAAPPGVELALWRYVAVKGSTAMPCTANTGTSPLLVGFAAMRPDRVRSEYSFDGRILSVVDGTGTELRYLYQAGVPRTGIVLGNLEAVYEPRSCSVAGTGVTGAEVTLASAIPTGCRAFRFGYDATGILTQVTDAAGRITTYRTARDTASTQPHLQTKTDASGVVTYLTSFGGGDTTGYCAAGYLCEIYDARGFKTVLRYQSYSTIPGIHAASWIKPKGLTTRTYARGGSAASVTAGAVRREYSAIDARGRVGVVRDTDAAGTVVFRETEYTWDSEVATGARCSLPGSRLDNKLCKVVRNQLGTGAAPPQTTEFTYNVDGALLSRRAGGGTAPATTTYGYTTQYFGTNNVARVWRDRVDGAGAVTPEGPTRTGPAGETAVYVVMDATEMLSPRGNSEPATPEVASACDTRDVCRAYLTRYAVDNVATVPPGIVSSGGFCGTDADPGVRAANSGLVCEVTGPVYDGQTGSGAAHSRALFRYDQFGQRESMVTPEAVRQAKKSNRYRYHYYDDTDRDLTGFVSAGGWLRGVTDPAGKFVAFGYDRAGNVIRTWDRRATARRTTTIANYPGTLDAPANDEYTQVLYGPGEAATAAAAPWRYVRSHRDALGNVTTSCHDPDGNPTVVRSPRGTAGSYTPPCPVGATTPGKYDTLYDTLDWNGAVRVGTDGKLKHAASPGGQHTSIVRPSGHNGTGTHVGSRVTYADELPTWIADELGHVREIVYDGAERPVKVRWTRGAADADSASDCTPGAASGAPFPAGRTICESIVSYDALDNVTSERDAAGARTDHEYDALSRRTVTLVPRTPTLALRHQWVYDADGNPLRYCPPRQFGTGDELAESGAPTGTDCPAGSAGRFSEHLTYDPAGRVATKTRYREQAGLGTSRAAAVEALVEKMTYDADGNMTTYADPRANAGGTPTHTVRREYDLQGRLVTQRVPFAATTGSDYVTTYDYDAAGNLLAETKPGSTTTPRITAYTYDALNRVRDTVEGADGIDGSAGLPDSVGGRNVRTRRLYDRDGNTVGIYGPRAFATSVSDPDASFLTRIDVDADGQPVVYHVPRSSATVTNVAHDNLDCEPAESSVWWYAPEAVTVPASMDPVPQYPAAKQIAICRSFVDYDAAGQVSRYIPPIDGGHNGTSEVQIDYRYSDDGLLTEVERPGANEGDARDVTRLRYDGAGRRRSVTESVNNRTWRWSHALDGTLTSASLPPSISGTTHVTTYAYNLAGEVVTTTNPAGEVMTARHHTDGLVAEQQDSGGNIVRHVYDRNGNPVRTYSPAAVHSIANPGSPDLTNPSGTPTSNFFDLADQLTTTLVPTAFDGTQVRRTDYVYDDAGRRKDTTTYLATCVTTNGRCEPGDLTEVAAIPGQSSGTQSLAYYRNDRVQQRVGRGSPRPTIGYEYDAAGNVTTVTDSTNPTATVTASYYLDGLVRTVEDGTDSGAYRTDYSYTGDGLVVARRNVPRGTSEATSEKTNYRYNDRRLLSSWDDYRENHGNNGGNDVTYDADGRPLAIESFDEKTTFSHDDDDTLISKTVTSKLDDEPLLAKWSYTYDQAQRTTSQQFQGQSVAYWDASPGGGAGTHGSLDDRTYSYTYDDAGRLDTFSQGATSIDIDHDRNGNRTKYGATMATFNPDDTIRTTSANTTPHSYAPFGGHLGDGCTTNTYDGFDRLSSVSATGCGVGVDSTYGYDGLDRQRSQSGEVDDGVQTRPLSAAMHYDGLGGALAVEVRGTGDWLRYVLDPGGNPVGSVVPNEAGSGTEFAHFDDGAGNLGLIIQSGGHHNPHVTPETMDHFGCSTRFDPYGDPVGLSNDRTNVCNTGTTSTARLYRGARRDPLTGAYQFGSRTYAPGRAGFLTPDAFATAGTQSNLGISVDPLTRNSYAYVNGDPVNLYDPTGHGWKDIREKGWGWLKSGAQQVGGVVKGFGEAAYEAGKGAVQVAWAGVALTGLRGQDAFNQTWSQTTEIYGAVKADPWGAGKAVAGAFAQGFRDDWQNGNYGEAVGRALFSALSSLATGGALSKVTGVDLRDLAAGARVAGGVTPSAPGGISASMPSSSRLITRDVGDLTARQSAVLGRLSSYGSSTVVRKRDFGQNDLVALTAATGDEFAMLSTGGRRMIVRGDIDSVPIDPDRAAELGAQGWRFSAHTHPGRSDLQLGSSPGDRAVLAAFGGRRSAIHNSVGRRRTFTPLGDSWEDWRP